MSSLLEEKEGELVGRHPDTISLEEYQKEECAIHLSAMKALRARCLDCCAGNSAEVRKCVATDCPSWPFRMGKYPKARKELRND